MSLYVGHAAEIPQTSIRKSSRQGSLAAALAVQHCVSYLNNQMSVFCVRYTVSHNRRKGTKSLTCVAVFWEKQNSDNPLAEYDSSHTIHREDAILKIN